MIKKIFLPALLLACLIFTACVAETETVAAPELIRPVAAHFDTAVIRRGNFVGVEQRTGITRYISVPVYFNHPNAAFDQFHVTTGDYVTEGQLLATLITEHFEEQLENQLEVLANIRRDQNIAMEIRMLDIDIAVLEHANRVQQAAEGQLSQEAAEAIELQALAIDRMILDMQQQQERNAMQIRQAENRVTELRSRITQAELRAPFDGRITNTISIGRGQPVGAAQALLFITDQNHIIVDAVNLLPIDWPDGPMDNPPDPWRPNLLRRTNYVQANINGEFFDLEYIPVALEERAARPVRFNILTDTPIAAGQYVTLTFYSHRLYDVVILPENAIFMSSEGAHVYRVVDGELLYTPVRFYGRTQIAAAVSLGLEEGDVVFLR